MDNAQSVYNANCINIYLAGWSAFLLSILTATNMFGDDVRLIRKSSPRKSVIRWASHR